EEMYEKYYHEEYKKRKECPVFDSTDIIKFGYVMDKNGQLKEWNRTKELMDAVWDVMVEHKDNRNANMKNLFRAYSKHHNPCQ
ncbi:hypothetical protein KAR91_15635, partial [Candidatus Pacearchaeota archaeon]|nr:hypothetical protein [Candidatus Pacearchaeota archaeon]